MTIVFQCINGHQLKIKDELAGKRIKCPKCQSTIQVPHPQESAPTDNVVEAVLVPTAKSVSNVATQAESNFASLDFDLPAAPQFAGGFGAGAATAAYMPQATDNQDLPAEFGSAAKKSLLIYGGSSTIASFVLVALSGLLFFGGSAKPEGKPASVLTQEASLNAANGATPTANPTSEPVASKEAAGNATASASVPAADAKSAVKPEGTLDKSATESVVGQAGSPLDLKPLSKNETGQSFLLPNAAIASLYDSSNSRYFLGNETAGILVFNLTDVLAGKLAPERVLSLDGGKPLAMCMRMVDKDQFLLVSTQESDHLQVFSTADWKAQPGIQIPMIDKIVEIQCHPSAANSTLFLAATSPETGGRSAHLHTYDLLNKTTTRHSDVGMQSLTISRDSRFVAAFNGSAYDMYEWDGRNLSRIKSIPTSKANGEFASDRFIESANVRTVDGSYVLKQVPGYNLTEFRKRPIGACWTDTAVQFVSTNDYRELHSVPLAKEWIQQPQLNLPSGRFSNKYLVNQLYVDEKLQAVVGRSLNKLLILNYGDLSFPKEPDLRPASAPPASIEIGQQMVGSFGLPTGTSLKYLPTIDRIMPMNEEKTIARIVGAPVQEAALDPTQSIVIRNEGAAPPLPLTKEDKVAWKPGKGTAGANLLRLEAALDGASRELFHRIQVTFPSLTVPFEVFGLSCDRDHETALVWGHAAVEGKKGTWKIAIVDLTRNKPVQTADIPARVLSGCIDKINFYICVDTKNDGQNPVPPYMSTMQMPSQGNSQLWMYELQSLKEVRRVPLTQHATKMESINGKELILDDKQPVSLPTLASKGEVNFMDAPLHGRVGGGWLSNGVLYDKELRKPLLCIYQPKIGPPNNQLYNRGFNGGNDGWLREQVGGPQFQMWFEQMLAMDELGEQIANFPALVRVVNGELELRVWPPSNYESRDNVSTTWQTKVFEAGDEAKKRIRSYPVATSNQSAVFAAGDRVWIVPLAGILPSVNFFQFAQVQDKFVLSAHKPNSVVYRANHASSYKLEIQVIGGGSQLTEINTLTSRDGKFNIEFDGDQFAQLATETIKSALNVSKVGQNEIKLYMQGCKDEIEPIADRKVSGVVVPVYAVVSAIHEDGKQRCEMRHWYLVEVSPNAILKLATPSR